MTDIATGWTVNRSVPNKARVWVIQAIDHAAGMFPFPIRGIDSDNGSEFINHHLLHYCEQHKITFTRGRAGKKNDGCYVEQKNWARVRELVGYYRYDTAAELELLNEIWHAASRGIDMRHHGLVREVPSGVTTTRAGTGRAPPTASRQAGRTAAASRLVSKIRLARLQTPSGAGATR